MSGKNRKLTDFTSKDGQQATKNSAGAQDTENDANDCNDDVDNVKDATESSTVCDCYHEMKNKYKKDIGILGINPPKCGHCIAYLCNQDSDGTADIYSSSLRIFIDKIHKENICIENVEFIDVRDYFEERSKQRLSTSTIGVDKAAIQGVISRFEAENKDFPIVSWKISENIDPKKYGNGTTFERDPLTDEEIEKLLTGAADFRNQLLILVSIEVGPRNEATCQIKTLDVDLEEQTIELENTKSGGTYVMPLTDNLTSLLRHWIYNIRSSYVSNENNSYLFPSRDGGKLSGESYRNIVHEAAEKAGIQEDIAKIPVSKRTNGPNDIDVDYRIKNRVDVHVLRHTFSRLLKDSGVSKDARTYALDHSTDVTEGYGLDKKKCREEIRNKFDGVNISAL